MARLWWYSDPPSPHQLKNVKVGPPLTKLSGSAHGATVLISKLHNENPLFFGVSDLLRFITSLLSIEHCNWWMSQTPILSLVNVLTFNSFLATGEFCRLLMIFANSLCQEQARRNVVCIPEILFSKKHDFEKLADDKKSWKIPQQAKN